MYRMSVRRFVYTFLCIKTKEERLKGMTRLNTQTLLIIVILVLILIPAIRTSIKHMKGEGDCCGGPKEKPIKKKISGPVLREVTVHIDGMHCQNCRVRIENHLNEMDGIVAKVNLNKNSEYHRKTWIYCREYGIIWANNLLLFILGQSFCPGRCRRIASQHVGIKINNRV